MAGAINSKVFNGTGRLPGANVLLLQDHVLAVDLTVDVLLQNTRRANAKEIRVSISIQL